MKKSLFFLTFSICLFTFSLTAVRQAFAQQYGWKDLSENIPIEGALTDVYFTSEDEGWITTAFADSTILHTTDGGASFEIQKVPLSPDIYAIHMLDSLNGYCGGPSGWIYKTSNGGQIWNILSSMGTFTDISFPPNTNPEDPIGYACGDAGNVWEITNTLTNLNSPSSSTFSGISAPSINNVYSCGGGRIYYYDGSGFTSMSTPGGTFNDIHFINDIEGWVIGNAGVIGKTIDGGDHWTPILNPDPLSRSLIKVFFITLNEGWAVGAEGVILHSTDGGINWVIEGEGLADLPLTSVHFTSPINGYVVGNNGTLLKYTNVSEVNGNYLSIQFELFPNPADESVRIHCSEFKTETGTIEILTSEGKTLQKKTVGKGNTDIEMELKDLAAGMYMCRITVGNKSSTRKLIIE